MAHNRPTFLVAAWLVLLVADAGAQQKAPIPEQPSVQPQIELDGVGIATLDGRFPRYTLASGARSSTSRISVSDSALLLGASKRLYNQGIGSVVLGATTTDQTDTGNGTGLMLHQLYVDYQGRAVEGYLGRTDTATRLFDFPTVRGDDLPEFQGVLDPFSNGVNTEEHRYGNVAAVVVNSGLRYFLNVHAQHLIASAAPVTDQAGINSYGLNLQYEGPPTLQAITRVPRWGIGYERQTIGEGYGGASNILYGGIVYNVNADPVDRVDLRLQETYTTGNSLIAFSDIADTFRAASNTITGSLRWLHSPFGTPAHQVALTLGYRTYQNVPSSATLGLALTGLMRIGDGFDLVAQYVYQHRDPAYAAAYSAPSDEQIVQVGFVFNFATTFNQHIGPRRSLLNLQHQCIPD